MAILEKAQHSIKHSIIDKTNSRTLATVSAAVFVVVFCLLACRSLIVQSLYQQRVITEKEKALDILKSNETAAAELRTTFDAFVSEPINIIGGNPAGDGPQDGDNAKIVLDALPQEYDFPGLASSVEKLLDDGGYEIDTIGGTEQLTADSTAVTAGPVQPVDIPYPFTVRVSPDSAKNLLTTLEQSIRPFYVDGLTLTGDNANLRLELNVRTFYQQGIGPRVTTKVVQ